MLKLFVYFDLLYPLKTLLEPWPGPDGDKELDHPGKSQVAVGLLRNFGKYLPEEAIGPRVQLLLRGGQ